MSISEHTAPGEDLLHRLSKGDLNSFRSLMEWYFPVLCGFAERFVGDKAQAEDIVQNTFIRVWERHTSFENILSLKKFLYVTTRNGCLNALRDRQRAEKRNAIFVQQGMEDERFAIDEIIYAELLAHIREMMETLPGKMKAVFKLAYVEGLNNQEIADRLQLSQQTIRNQKTRALQLLKDRMGKKIDISI